MSGFAVTIASIATLVMMTAATTNADRQPAAEHVVKMVQVDGKYRFDPEVVEAKIGDRVTFVLVSGGPHNIAFADSIPEPAKVKLSAALPERISPLAGKILTEAGSRYTIELAGVPAGSYGFYCMPHMSMGMTGTLVVR